MICGFGRVKTSSLKIPEEDFVQIRLMRLPGEFDTLHSIRIPGVGVYDLGRMFFKDGKSNVAFMSSVNSPEAIDANTQLLHRLTFAAVGNWNFQLRNRYTNQLEMEISEFSISVEDVELVKAYCVRQNLSPHLLRMF
jgi:hypothetical protein